MGFLFLLFTLLITVTIKITCAVLNADYVQELEETLLLLPQEVLKRWNPPPATVLLTNCPFCWKKL
jgi:hypothetical protein